MFKCDKCGESSRYPHRVVAETRNKIYYNVYANKKKRIGKVDDFSNTIGEKSNIQKFNDSQYARGTEIVKELNLCDKCYETFINKNKGE